MSEVVGNSLYIRDAETGALIPVYSAGGEFVVEGNRAFVRDAETGALLPVIAIAGGNGGGSGVQAEDAGDTIIEGTADIATRILNKRCYKTSSYMTVKIDEDVKIQIDSSSIFITATSGKFNVRGRQFTKMEMYIPDPEGNPMAKMITDFMQIYVYNATSWNTYNNTSEDFYVVYLETEAGNCYKITTMDDYLEIEKISL
jgi:hypothetical protein